MSTIPFISIIIPVKNFERTIEKTLFPLSICEMELRYGADKQIFGLVQDEIPDQFEFHPGRLERF